MLQLRKVTVLNLRTFFLGSANLDEPKTFLDVLVNAFETQAERLSDALSTGNDAKLTLKYMIKKLLSVSAETDVAGYSSPAVEVVEMRNEGVLCYSTLEENEEWDEVIIP